jgi:hypothetical protein
MCCGCILRGESPFENPQAKMPESDGFETHRYEKRRHQFTIGQLTYQICEI